MAGSYVHGNEPSGFIKGGHLLDQLSDYNFSNKESDPRSWLAGWSGQLVDCHLLYVIFIQALHVFYTFWIWLCLTAAAIRYKAYSILSEAG